MLRNVFAKTIRDQRRALVWWTIGLVGYVVMIVAVYPTVHDNARQLTRYVDQWPKSMRALFGIGGASDFGTPAGYLNAELFGFMLPLLFAIYAVAAGARAIAGEEENGTLDLLLANPLPRWRVVMEKFAALAVGTAILATVVWVSLSVGAAAANMDISVGRLAAAMVGVALMAIVLGGLALTVGCLRGGRSLAIGVTGGVGVATFLLNSLAPVVAGLEPYRTISPFHYAFGNEPLVNGFDAGHLSVLLAVSALLAVASWVTFERRDLAG